MECLGEMMGEILTLVIIAVTVLSFRDLAERWL